MTDQIKVSEVSAILRQQLEGISTGIRTEEVGTVLQVSDGVARIYGLDNAEANELLQFDNGMEAIVMNLEEDNVGAVLLGPTDQVKEGDIVIIDSSYKLYPFTPDTNTDKDQRLLVGEESANWFKEHKVKAVGFGDGVSIENCNEDVKPFHDILMAENIVFLEVLRNLEQLKSDVFFMSYSPLPIKGLDSSPVRAYAIEGLAEFSE